MKQLLILSGKGGTGKTTVAGAFIKLAQAKAYADCDVDAPNLHLIMDQQNEPKRTDYFGLSKAEIDTNKCIECDLCRQHCRFDAIHVNSVYEVDKLACEGCGVCEVLCPVGAITLIPAKAGELMLYSDRTSVFSTAQLLMGSGNTGMLVSEVKKQLKNAAVDTDLVIIDGSPGIGCPVIASITGVDLVLIVSEPSVSGISDMERVVRTAERFKIRVAVCINKYDTNLVNSAKIETYCESKGIAFVGKIPYDIDAIKAINMGQTIVDIECNAGREVKTVYDKTMSLFY